MAGIGVLATAGYGLMLQAYTNAYAPFIDSAVLMFSIVAQLLLMGGAGNLAVLAAGEYGVGAAVCEPRPVPDGRAVRGVLAQCAGLVVLLAPPDADQAA
jgi:hypothetical protein